MRYEKIEKYEIEDIEKDIFENASSLEQKVTSIYSAIYFLEIEIACELLIKVLQRGEKELKFATVNMLDAYMQSRSTTHGYQLFIDEINCLKVIYPENAHSLKEVEEALFEFKSIFD